MKKIFFILLALLAIINAKSISKEQCSNLKGSYIFSGGECIHFASFEGEVKDKLIVTVHGAWKEGADTLSRYKTFAENLNLESDITTVAVALPGYSGSSTNHIQALTHNKNAVHMAATKAYVEFLATLLKDLKSKFKAKELTVVAHSAGAMATATVLGYKPKLIQNAILAGGRYDIHKIDKTKGLISAVDFVDKISKESKIALVYGTKDAISKPEVTKKFYQLAKSNGVNVTIVEVKDAPHLDLDMQEKSIETLLKMVK